MALWNNLSIAIHNTIMEWRLERKVAFLLISLSTAHIIYYLTKRYLEYHVRRNAILIVPVTLILRSLKADIDFGRSHGCRPPPELPYSWPLGIDRIKQLWDSNSEGHLLAFLCSIADNYEPRNNLSQYLLVGPRAFHILHPRNVEALMSTNFQGKYYQYNPT